jgi:hypothetical protein
VAAVTPKLAEQAGPDVSEHQSVLRRTWLMVGLRASGGPKLRNDSKPRVLCIRQTLRNRVLPSGQRAVSL